jgi:hypothetical protein
MAKIRPKLAEMELLEGGGAGGMGGGGRRGAYDTKKQQERLDAIPPKERAALENPGEQFRAPNPVAEKTQAKIKPATKREQERLDAVPPKERAALENPGEQFRVNSDGMKKGGKVTASQRADGIATKGKTRGKMY